MSHREALQWCEEVGAEYLEGSAKEDIDVDKPFLRAAQRALQQVNQWLYILIKTGKTQHICMFNMFIFDDKRYITPYSTKNTHWKIQDISR